MKNKDYNVIVTTAGNSPDCVDLAPFKFHFKSSNWSIEILESVTIGYSQKWINVLQSAVDCSEMKLGN